MNLVMIVSPYSDNPRMNVAYARECMQDALRRGEAPFASHLLYPQVLDDATLAERDKGMQVSYSWMAVCDIVACYTDRGWSKGMLKDLKMAITLGRKIVFRALKPHTAQPLDVQELITHAQGAGLTVVVFDEEGLKAPFDDYLPDLSDGAADIAVCPKGRSYVPCDVCECEYRGLRQGD